MINYTPEKFEAYPIDSIISSQGQKRKAKSMDDLKVALDQFFLKCEIGDTDLNYDARIRWLAWRADTGVIVATYKSMNIRIVL